MKLQKDQLFSAYIKEVGDLVIKQNQTDEDRNIHLLNVDDNGDVYVADWHNHRIQLWSHGSSTGVTVAGGNGQGISLSQINNPHSVILDTNKNIYVADYGNHRVVKWLVGAKSGIIIAGRGGEGSGASQPDCPTALKFDKIGN
ncbi:unnamed protein product, partial [Didymodactylos carnosus]